MPKSRFPKRKPDPPDPNEARPGGQGIDPGQAGPDSGGQSGNTQGLSSTASIANESIEELASDDQAFEASFVDGVADAANHPGQPVHTHVRKAAAI